MGLNGVPSIRRREPQAHVERSMPAPGVPAATSPIPRVVILGGGLAGRSAAMPLPRSPVPVTLTDRSNPHRFPPRHNQVATPSVTPADSAQPIRWILRRQRNTEVLLAE